MPLIQHLNIIVDPAGSFLLTAADPFNTGTNPVAIPDPSTNNAAGGSTDPGNPLVRNPGRDIRPGGSGVQPNRHIGAGHSPPPPPPPPPKQISFVQGKFGFFPHGAAGETVVTDDITFGGNVTAGNLVVVLIRFSGQNDNPLPAVTNVVDSFGTRYVLAGQVAYSKLDPGPGPYANPIAAWVYYGIAAATGFCTVSYTMDGGSRSPAYVEDRYSDVCEYQGVSRSGPLGHVASGAGEFGLPVSSVTFTPGPVRVDGPGGLIVLSAFLVLGSDRAATVAGSDSAAAATIRDAAGALPLSYVADFYPCPVSPGITPSITGPQPAQPLPTQVWVAVAASFNKA
jgi:hypothetical protein